MSPIHLLAVGLATLLAAPQVRAADTTAREVTEQLFRASGPVDLSGRDLEGLDLSLIDFKKTRLAKSNMFGVNLTGSNLTGADLSSVNLD
ncbi:MAG TPA: pentapeptide repeat-containing protein, partial [Hyphomicrobium sp.]|nr:pentapeptide repeat-containing protein [Hyphomicrobium sp.]